MMLENLSDYISLIVVIIILFITLKIFIGVIFYNKNYNYNNKIDIFKDYEDYDG